MITTAASKDNGRDNSRPMAAAKISTNRFTRRIWNCELFVDARNSHSSLM